MPGSTVLDRGVMNGERDADDDADEHHPAEHDAEPSIRLEREEARVAAAHSTAAMSPPRIAVTRPSVTGCAAGLRRGRRPSGRRDRLCYHPPSRPALTPCRRAVDHPTTSEVAHLGQDAPHLDGRSHAVRTQARPSGPEPPRGPPAAPQRREDIRREGPGRRRRLPADSRSTRHAALAEALSALDRAAKAGAIHPNAAARRKSRLTRKVNAALGGAHGPGRRPRHQVDRQGSPPRRPPRPASPPARPARPRAPRPPPARPAPR